MSTTVVVSAASAGLPIAATTSQSVPVSSASVQLPGVQVHFTQEQTAMADALEIPVALKLKVMHVLSVHNHIVKHQMWF